MENQPNNGTREHKKMMTGQYRSSILKFTSESDPAFKDQADLYKLKSFVEVNYQMIESWEEERFTNLIDKVFRAELLNKRDNEPEFKDLLSLQSQLKSYFHHLKYNEDELTHLMNDMQNITDKF